MLIINKDDIAALIEMAQRQSGKFLLGTNYRNTAGSVGAALLTANNYILFTGINLDMKCGIGFCAEQSAIMEMLKTRQTEIYSLVNVHYNGDIYLPCGKCREFMVQLNENNLKTKIITPEKRIITIKELLPY
ncbi:MAG: cytidine deaminase [Oscillospiraceae bacterium]|jgi:cytidine deaminase|nr:cytidine deaminase [Oscillospiraceae bacterium]